jgi:hypothetical protein
MIVSVAMPIPETRIDRTAYLSFLECDLRDNWSKILYKDGYEWHHYKAMDEAEVWIVRQDGLKRGFKFKKDSQIKVGMIMLMFVHKDLIEEISIDEDERSGNVPLSKLKFD